VCAVKDIGKPQLVHQSCATVWCRGVNVDAFDLKWLMVINAMQEVFLLSVRQW
jgi:hypothetical protein